MQAIINSLKRLSLLAFAGILLSSCADSNAKTKKETGPLAPQKLPVDVIVVKSTTLNQLDVIAGSILPNRTVEIMSELPKKITAVSFKDGSYVRQGQVLYKLDDADVRAKLRQLEAELNLARINEHRLNELLKTETVRQEEYDIALAKLQSLQAAKDILAVELSKTFIRAPFSGIAGITKVYTGAIVGPGMPLVSLEEQETLKVQFSVSEKHLALVQTGNKIQFSTELSDEMFTATVASTEASVDPQSRNIIVQAIATGIGGKLKAGMSARVYFKTSGQHARGISIPTESLIPGGNGYSVFVIKNSTARLTPVTISNRNEKEAIISIGLSNGDTVMTSNILRAADGVPVTVVTNR
jgi:membrane fusion protein (multidrug efflux system)